MYRIAVAALGRAVRALSGWRGVAADDREISAWARPVGGLAVVWLLIEGVTLLDLRMEPRAGSLAVLVPALWILGVCAAYQ